VISVTFRTRHSVHVSSGQSPITLGGDCDKCNIRDKTLSTCFLGTVTHYTRRRLNIRHILYIVPSVFKTLGTKRHSVKKLRCCMDLTVMDSCTEHRHSEKNTRYSTALSVIGTNTQNKKTLDTIVSILYRVFCGGTQYKNTRYNNSKIINIFKCVFHYSKFT
jgi:hypothetical protein